MIRGGASTAAAGTTRCYAWRHKMFRTASAVLSSALFTWLMFAAALFPSSASAAVTGVSCYVTGSGYLDFGAVNLFEGNTDAVITVSYTCGATASPSGTAYVDLCVDLGTGSGGSTYSPRLMAPTSGSTGLTLQYNFYSDAARTVIVGSSASGSYPPLSLNVQFPVTNYYSTYSGTITLYARVPSGQGNAISSPNLYYQSNFTGTASALKYGWSATSAPASCTAGTGTASVGLGIQVQAHIQSGCFVATATDLDFGQSVAAITANKDQASGISIACTSTSPWQIGLSNGAHYSNSSRHMVGASGALISYQLYRNAARTLLWGNTLNSDTVTGTGAASTQVPVYGRIPPQTAAGAGVYSDIVTVTLTY